MGVTLFALLAFGMLTVASASAAVTFLLAEWLVGGSGISTELLTETTGEFLLEDIALKSKILCSGIFDGWYGPNSLGYISEVLSLSAGLIAGTALGGSTPRLRCEAQEGCSATAPAEVVAVNLGWETEVELMEDDGSTFFVILFTSNNGSLAVGWTSECTIAGVRAEDACTTTQVVGELTLEGTNLLENFSDAFTELAELKLANCSVGGTEKALAEGGGIIALSEGGELAASSEGVTA
jgi:hypothetical protein